MSQKTLTRLLLSTLCSLPLASYAYVIGSNLIIDNNTDTNMHIRVNLPSNKANPGDTDTFLYDQDIRPGEHAVLYVDNGDQSGHLYTASAALFNIKNAVTGKEYVNGRIVFYVHGTYNQKYSFLDSLQQAQGIDLNFDHSCDAQYSGVIMDNKIVLGGHPSDAEAPQALHNTFVRCQQIKSATLTEVQKPTATDDNLRYDFSCLDNRRAPKVFFHNREIAKQYEVYGYGYQKADMCRPNKIEMGACQWWGSVFGVGFSVDPVEFTANREEALKNSADYSYCGGWGSWTAPLSP